MKLLIRAALLASLLSACTTMPARQAGNAEQLAAQSAREAALVLQPDWSMTGRLAVSANGDGGSGRIDWRQRGEDYRIRLSAPVTRRSWVLNRKGGLITLEGLEGGTREGRDADQLLAEATGVPIPMALLAAWARGARAEGPSVIEFSADGLPALISQHGWVVEYREWDTSEPARPRRIFARQGEQASVRLVVESWESP